eukprot:351834-Chlamydomonas_euryale.AAC.2
MLHVSTCYGKPAYGPDDATTHRWCGKAAAARASEAPSHASEARLHGQTCAQRPQRSRSGMCACAELVSAVAGAPWSRCPRLQARLPHTCFFSGQPTHKSWKSRGISLAWHDGPRVCRATPCTPSASSGRAYRCPFLRFNSRRRRRQQAATSACFVSGLPSNRKICPRPSQWTRPVWAFGQSGTAAPGTYRRVRLRPGAAGSGARSTGGGIPEAGIRIGGIGTGSGTGGG